MGRRGRAQGFSRQVVQAAVKRMREEDDEAAAVAQRVYNATTQAKATGEAGDVSPLLWGPLVTFAEMMAAVVVKANGLSPELHEEVAAYFVASNIAAGHGFDFAHFEQWRRAADGPVSDEQDPAGD